MKTRSWLSLTGVAALFAVAAVSQPVAPFEVIGLPAGTARVRAGTASISLGPGSPAWTIPLDTPVTVVSGGIWAQFGEATIKAWPGDGLRFTSNGDGVQVEATAGKLLIERPDGSTRQLEAGQTFAMTAPAAPRTHAKPPGGGCGASTRRGGTVTP